jgi:translation initiation factor 2-alpha kinase 4
MQFGCFLCNSQKVDIYSLGIIFFEMCYHPLPTGMERVKVLINLRNSEIIFPFDFTEDGRPQQVHIIRYVLLPLNMLDSVQLKEFKR